MNLIYMVFERKWRMIVSPRFYDLRQTHNAIKTIRWFSTGQKPSIGLIGGMWGFRDWE